MDDPLSKSREDYADVIERLGSPDSPVGIDVQFTHAVIIDYLRQITERLDRIEERLGPDDAR